jgi:GntR family transcriptional regulator / MocR family aminotransferase
MLLVLDGDGPVYLQIYRSLRERIVKGVLPAGARLPSTRTTAAELQVARNTVLQAYEQLLAEGYVVGHIGSGTFVAQVLPDSMLQTESPSTAHVESDAQVGFELSQFAQRAQAWNTNLKPRRRPLRYDFRYGQPDINSFPFDVWRRLLTRRASHSALESFAYGAPEGNLELRRAIVDYLSRSRGVHADVDQVLVVNGSQQGLDLIGRALLDPGDTAVIEEPSYTGAREVFRAAGAQLVLGDVDGEGLNLETLPPVTGRVRLVYVTPSHQFPTGVIMSARRRLELLAWAKATKAYVIEDDYDSEFRFDCRPVEAVQALDHSGRVIYLGTLSKTVFPGLRLGYLVVPKHLIEPLRTIKLLSDRHTATFQQEVLTDFIAEGHFERHLRRARRVNAARRETLVSALHREFGGAVEIQGANAGLHVLMWLKGRTSDELPSIIAGAEALGVGVYPVTSYYMNPPREAGLVLGYGALEEQSIREGIPLLAKSLSLVAAA